MQGLRGPGEEPYTFLYAVKSARDQMELRIYEMMYTVVDEGEEKQLVPYEKALGQIQEKYSSISNAALKYAGLRYAAILMDGEEHRYEGKRKGHKGDGQRHGQGRQHRREGAEQGRHGEG